MRFPLLLVGLLSAAEWALAQSHSRPDPADPRAPAPLPRYQPAFPDYQPFVEQKNSWKQVNQEVADSPAMGSMQHKPGMTMPGLDKPAAGAPKGKEGAGGHDTMAMAKQQTATGQPANTQTARITGTGSVQLIDKVNSRVKLTHDPIAAMGWPKMTLFFRLKESSLADQVKEGDRVEFSLERSASGLSFPAFSNRFTNRARRVSLPAIQGTDMTWPILLSWLWRSCARWPRSIPSMTERRKPVQYVTRWLALTAALATSTALAPGDSHSKKKAEMKSTEFGQTGDPRKVTRTVKIDMSDAMRFAPAEIPVKRGETVRFVVTNSGKQMHEMVLGSMKELKEHAELMKKHPGMEHDEPYMAHVQPGKKADLVWQFTNAGEFYYGCLIPGHFEAGMIGKVIVK